MVIFSLFLICFCFFFCFTSFSFATVECIYISGRGVKKNYVIFYERHWYGRRVKKKNKKLFPLSPLVASVPLILCYCNAISFNKQLSCFISRPHKSRFLTLFTFYVISRWEFFIILLFSQKFNKRDTVKNSWQ